MNQKVGNFPGVTIDKKTGNFYLDAQTKALVTDLPGMYSLYPKKEDEWVSYKMLLDDRPEHLPDLIIIVADASNLKRNLLFCSQIIDLKHPTIIALTMMDLCKKKGTIIDLDALQREMGVPIVGVNPRKNKGMEELKRTIAQVTQTPFTPAVDFVTNAYWGRETVEAIQKKFPHISEYHSLHYAIHFEGLDLEPGRKNEIKNCLDSFPINKTKAQADEILHRYGRIKQVLKNSVTETNPRQKELRTEQLDKILLHRYGGFVILLAVLFIMFQSVFWLAHYPMDWIENGFGELSKWLWKFLPDGWASNLLINGVLAGLSGILIFVPQIMILFALVTILEDSGYMARISFLSDRLMRKAGLNGKSVMPMISGFACAVPAIMSARSIENKKERLLTILITPLMSCSARLPVYTILISLVIPPKIFIGFISLQGLIMMALYFSSTVIALMVSWVLKFFINIKERSFFILELPVYREPRWNNVLHTMIAKARIFVVDAGKIIMIISLVLWFLSSYGPPQKMRAIENKYALLVKANPAGAIEIARQHHTEKLENSFAGILGKAIEPAIKPLGYDWKIGIALITSFAAREVFVGTMATLYSAGDDQATLHAKMRSATRADGTRVYTLASGLSLLIFYMLSMQCMSTLAVVKRETGSWKWPVFQLVYMTGLAYLMSWMVYVICK
jgi:ferrous iron transport protein B